METIKQLSVFLENKGGRINDVAKALGEHGINMHAFSMAETTDFGILRLIVSDVEQAVGVWPSIRYSSSICMLLPKVRKPILSFGRATWRNALSGWKRTIATFWPTSSCRLLLLD